MIRHAWSNFVAFVPPIFALAVLSACAPARPTLIPDHLVSPYNGYTSAGYSRDSMWLCRPDLLNDVCHGDLTATEITADGARVVQPHHAAENPDVDCFYVYPTVDMSLLPGNHTDLGKLAPMRDAARAQAARLSEVCAVYAPLYRQVTIGTYMKGDPSREAYMETAFSDVLDAFLHYLGHYNHGRKVVLVGHSQGGEMVSRLLVRLFDGDAELRKRLVVAMPIGADIQVPRGKLVGGSFENIPLCSAVEERGCVVAFQSRHQGSKPSRRLRPKNPDREIACVNPANPAATDWTPMARAYFPLDDGYKNNIHGIDGVATPFVMFHDYYKARCDLGDDGYHYLAVEAAPANGDKRADPINLNDFRLNSMLGTHILDMQFTQGDLIDLIRKKAEAK